SVARAGGELAFSPAAAGVSWALGPAVDLYEGIRQGAGSAERIAELEEANAELESELDAARLDQGRADQLEDMLHLSGLGGYEVVPAQAVTRVTSQGYAHTVTLDVGSDSGVTSDMTVVNGEGLVGRVVDAGPRTSTVLLATDGTSAVGARLESTRTIGAVHGGALPGGADRQVTSELSDMDGWVEAADWVVPLGAHVGAPFVPGVPIGSAEEAQVSPGALGRVACISPDVDFTSLDLVGLVVAGPAEDP